jgi:hypothetical protein
MTDFSTLDLRNEMVYSYDYNCYGCYGCESDDDYCRGSEYSDFEMLLPNQTTAAALAIRLLNDKGVDGQCSLRIWTLAHNIYNDKELLSLLGETSNWELRVDDGYYGEEIVGLYLLHADAQSYLLAHLENLHPTDPIHDWGLNNGYNTESKLSLRPAVIQTSLLQCSPHTPSTTGRLFHPYFRTARSKPVASWTAGICPLAIVRPHPDTGYVATEGYEDLVDYVKYCLRGYPHAEVLVFVEG